MNFGVQLYTLRKSIRTPQGYADTFAKLKNMGVTYVQVSGGCPMAAKELRKIADDNGIRIMCDHIKLKDVMPDMDKYIEDHLILGCDATGVGSMDPAYKADNYARLGEYCDLINTVAEKVNEAGMRFTYHNHFDEFKTINGEKILDTLINRCPNLDFLLDTYWVIFAGNSIEEYIDKLNGRLKHVHFKDMKKPGIIFKRKLMCEVGSGRIDFESLIPKFAAAGTEYAYIEQDISRNPIKSVEKSWNYLCSLK